MSDVSQFTDGDKERYFTLKKQIKESWITFAQSIIEVKQKELWCLEYGTFEDFCKTELGFSDRRARQMIASAEVVENIGTTVPAPQSERQARPLTKLDKEKQAEAWKEVTETTPAENITSEVVERVADKYKETPTVILSSVPSLIDRCQAGETVITRPGATAVVKWAKDNGKYVNVGRKTQWANPFNTKDGKPSFVKAAYRRYLKDKKSLHKELKELKGMVLVCDDDSKYSHAQVLKEFADKA